VLSAEEKIPDRKTKNTTMPPVIQAALFFDVFEEVADARDCSPELRFRLAQRHLTQNFSSAFAGSPQSKHLFNLFP
jgi:hypothetical protein